MAKLSRPVKLMIAMFLVGMAWWAYWLPRAPKLGSVITRDMPDQGRLARVFPIRNEKPYPCRISIGKDSFVTYDCTHAAP